MSVLNLLKKHRRLVLFVLDALMLLVTHFIALLTINLLSSEHIYIASIYKNCLSFSCAALLGMWAVGVYKSIWRYAGAREYLKCVFGNVLGTAVCYIICKIFKVDFPELCALIGVIMSICCILLSRVVYNFICNEYVSIRNSGAEKTNVLIIGAGNAGTHILTEFKNHTDKYSIVGFVDDDKEKIGRFIDGVRVWGNTGMIPKLVEKLRVKTIIFSIPSVSQKDKSRILAICSETVCELKILPGVKKLMGTGEGLVKQLSPIKVEDVLGREEVNFDCHEVAQLISGSVCMVTGGGGSIGSELSRQIAGYKPQKIIIVDIYENNAYDVEQELRRKYKGDLNLNIEIASVRDYTKMESLFIKYKPDIIFHAAAHKHVPLMETNPEEAVKNNIFGTYNVAKLASEYSVKKFVLVSTDKAVNPTNIMGATKRFCEMLVEYFAQKKTKTEYVAVRFGNVLGSNGSVIPLFEKQIALGGPVTVTHPEIERYFMTIPEAVSLILQAATLARGGEIFVLDMGEAVKILDLAKKMIMLHGKVVNRDIQIEFTGLRPGEKLYEELLMNEEGLKKTSNKKIYIGHQVEVREEELLRNLSDLENAAKNNDKELIESILKRAVPTFIRNEEKTAI